MKYVQNKFHQIIILFSALLVNTALASDLPKTQPEFLSPDEAFVVSYELINEKQVNINWNIHPGYYLYMGMFEFESLDQQNKIKKVEMPDGKKKTDEFFGEVDIYYNSTEAEVYLENSIYDYIELKIKYQGCADAGLCYPPVFKTIKVKKKLASSNLKKVSFFESQNAISESLNINSLIYNIFIFYLAGLLLAFTPCVLPMVPILTGIIAGQGNVSQKRSITLSSIYVISMSLTYALAGIVVASSGTNIQASLQNPYVLGFISLLFFIFALAMFKFFDIQMPKSIQTLMTNISNKQKSGGVKDVAVMGVLSALIVGPCVTAPLIGALIYIAATGDAFVGGLALFFLGLGMGTPLIILGSSTTKLISKIGPYLELVNYFFGMLFVFVSVWLLERIVSMELAAYLWSISAIIFVIVLSKSYKLFKSFLSKTIGYTLSIVSLFYFLIQIYGIKNNNYYDPITSFIQKNQSVKFIEVKTIENLNKELTNSDRLIMVDLYADWCVACKELEKYTFSNQKVSNILNEFKLIKLDITQTTEEHSEYLKNLKIFGPPALLFYDQNGNEIESARVVGFMESENFLEVLRLLKKS
ncbi:MAG: protein-disulfide reductase DsbD [Gammaproteobacteria bacterium]